MWTGGDAAAAKAKKSSKKGAQAADAGRELERELIAAAKAGLGRGGRGWTSGEGHPSRLPPCTGRDADQDDPQKRDARDAARHAVLAARPAVRGGGPAEHLEDGGAKQRARRRARAWRTQRHLPPLLPLPPLLSSPSQADNLAVIFAPVLLPTDASAPPMEQLQRAKDGVRRSAERAESHPPRPTPLPARAGRGVRRADALPLSCRGQVTLVKSLLVTHEKDRPKPAASDLAEGDESATGIDINGDGAVGEVPPAA